MVAADGSGDYKTVAAPRKRVRQVGFLEDLYEIVVGDTMIVGVPGIGGSLAVVAALHSRIHRFRDKLMDLKPHVEALHELLPKAIKTRMLKLPRGWRFLLRSRGRRRRRRSLITRGSVSLKYILFSSYSLICQYVVYTQDVAGPSLYSSQPRSKRSNNRKRSVDTSSSHTPMEPGMMFCAVPRPPHANPSLKYKTKRRKIRNDVKTDAKEWGVAVTLYLEAASAWPHSGNPQNQVLSGEVVVKVRTIQIYEMRCVMESLAKRT
ncbi:hypothetical protein Tco_0503688 [Tanacetum coccineum]